MTISLRTTAGLLLIALLSFIGCRSRVPERSITIMLEPQALAAQDQRSKLLVLADRPTPHYVYEDYQFDSPEFSKAMPANVPFRIGSGPVTTAAFDAAWEAFIHAGIPASGRIDIRHGEGPEYGSILILKNGKRTSTVTVGRISLYWRRGVIANSKAEAILDAWRRVYLGIPVNFHPATDTELNEFLNSCGAPWPGDSPRMAIWYNIGRMLRHYPEKCLAPQSR